MNGDSIAKDTKSQDKDYHKPSTVEDMTARNVQTIVRLEETAKAERAKSDQIADIIANFCGSMPFVWAHLIGFAAWIIINTMPGVDHFDSFPFTFLTLIVSLEAIFLSTFILISQNQETRLSERRNQLDLQINLLTEQENTKMLTLLGRIAEKVGVKTDDDPSLQCWSKPPVPNSSSIRSRRLPSKPRRPRPRTFYNNRIKIRRFLQVFEQSKGTK
jgi:uncharacterized membrane protein